MQKPNSESRSTTSQQQAGGSKSHRKNLQALDSHSEGTEQGNAEGHTSASYTGWQVSSEMVSCCSTLPPCGASAPRICMLSWRCCQSKSSMPKDGSLTKPQSPSIRRPAHSLRGRWAGGTGQVGLVVVRVDSGVQLPVLRQHARCWSVSKCLL